MSKADKKQRHKAKRQAKRLAARRRESISPVKRLGDAKGEVDCWMSEDFDLHRQMQIFVYKRAGGLTGIACFLIDQGVVGLKDAWTRLGIDRAEFDRMIDSCDARGLPMRQVGMEEARRWVAGGVRWAHDNGMRLPKDWARAASLIGGAGDWKSADVSAFVKEFAGHPEDLRQRLIGEPLETYLQRTDIDFIFSDAAPYMDQKTGRYASTGPFEFEDLDSDDDSEAIDDYMSDEEVDRLADRLTPAAAGLVAETTNWLTERGQTPSPELLEAWRSLMMASMLSKTAMPDADEDEVADFGYEILQDLSRRIEESRFPEYERAVGQALEHLDADSMMMKKAVLQHGVAGEQDDQPES